MFLPLNKAKTQSNLTVLIDESTHSNNVSSLSFPVRVVDVVEGEGLVRAQPRLRLSGGFGDACLASVDDLPRQLWPDTGGHPDTALVVTHRDRE